MPRRDKRDNPAEREAQAERVVERAKRSRPFPPRTERRKSEAGRPPFPDPERRTGPRAPKKR